MGKIMSHRDMKLARIQKCDLPNQNGGYATIYSHLKSKCAITVSMVTHNITIVSISTTWLHCIPLYTNRYMYIISVCAHVQHSYTLSVCICATW